MDSSLFWDKPEIIWSFTNFGTSPNWDELEIIIHDPNLLFSTILHKLRDGPYFCFHDFGWTRQQIIWIGTGQAPNPSRIRQLFLQDFGMNKNEERGHVLRRLAFAGTSSAARGHAAGTSVCGDELYSAGTRFDFNCVTFPLVFRGQYLWGRVPLVFTVFPLVYDYEHGSFSLEYAI